MKLYGTCTLAIELKFQQKNKERTINALMGKYVYNAYRSFIINFEYSYQGYINSKTKNIAWGYIGAKAEECKICYY